MRKSIVPTEPRCTTGKWSGPSSSALTNNSMTGPPRRRLTRVLTISIVLVVVVWCLVLRALWWWSNQSTAPERSSVFRVPRANYCTIALLIMKTTIDTARHPLRVEAILETWASQAELNYNDISLFFVDSCVEGADAGSKFEKVPNVHFLCYNPKELGDKKTRHMMWALRRIASDFPSVRFFVKGDDVTYFILGNLRWFFQAHPQIQYTGSILRLPFDPNTEFISGGAGMVFSRTALETCLLKYFNRLEPEYLRKKDDFLLRSEDLAVAACMDPTKPESYNKGSTDGEFFNAYGPMRIAEGDYDKWYRDYKGKMVQSDFHARTVTFHYMDHAMTRFFYKVWTEAHTWTGTVDSLERAAQEILQNAPRSGVGGYETKITKLQQARKFVQVVYKLVKETSVAP